MQKIKELLEAGYRVQFNPIDKDMFSMQVVDVKTKVYYSLGFFYKDKLLATFDQQVLEGFTKAILEITNKNREMRNEQLKKYDALKGVQMQKPIDDVISK